MNEMRHEIIVVYEMVSDRSKNILNSVSDTVTMYWEYKMPHNDRNVVSILYDATWIQLHLSLPLRQR